MSFSPKIQIKKTPVPCGNGNTSRLWNFEVNALLWSQSHYRLKNGKWSGGGEFLKASQTASHGTQRCDWRRFEGLEWHGNAAGCGGLLPSSTFDVPVSSAGGPNFASIISSFGKIDQHRNDTTNVVDFTSGWGKTRPDSPEASLAQFAAELRDFPLLPGYQFGKNMIGRNTPSMRKYKNSFLRGWLNGPIERIPGKIQAQLGVFKALGSEYLNWVFGWEPFVRDLQKLYIVSQTIDNRIKQLARDNGRGIRRRATIRNDATTTTDTRTLGGSPFYGALQAPPSWPTGGSTWTSVSRVERKSWFSARYRYYIPDVGSGAWIPQAKTALYGANITPSVVWELTPWSWLTDWFLNVGDVLSNFSEHAVDNLVADYAYCMIHTKRTTTNTSISSWNRFGCVPASDACIPAGSSTLSSTYTWETKVRLRGSPYGLGVKFNSLSGRQLGILAALGITQSSF